MSEWLDVMLGEIARKKEEAEAAKAEHASREKDEDVPKAAD
jgi:hypothetical protein